MRVRPLRDLLVVERLEGHGVERTLPSGIIIPATAESSVQTKRDTFRARVTAIGPEAERMFHGRLSVGDVVHVYTYAETEDGESALYTGKRSDFGLIIQAKDIVCAEEAA